MSSAIDDRSNKFLSSGELDEPALLDSVSGIAAYEG